MPTQSIGLIAGAIFLFIAIIGGGIVGKENQIPVIGSRVRMALGLLGVIFCLPFLIEVWTGLSGVPKGTIIVWSRESGPIPPGWKLCNGLEGTPNLNGRFLRGVNDLSLTGADDTKENAWDINVLTTGYTEFDDPKDGYNAGSGSPDVHVPGVHHNHTVPLPPHFKVIFLMKK